MHCPVTALSSRELDPGAAGGSRWKQQDAGHLRPLCSDGVEGRFRDKLCLAFTLH